MRTWDKKETKVSLKFDNDDFPSLPITPSKAKGAKGGPRRAVAPATPQVAHTSPSRGPYSAAQPEKVTADGDGSQTLQPEKVTVAYGDGSAAQPEKVTEGKIMPPPGLEAVLDQAEEEEEEGQEQCFGDLGSENDAQSWLNELLEARKGEEDQEEPQQEPEEEAVPVQAKDEAENPEEQAEEARPVGVSETSEAVSQEPPDYTSMLVVRGYEAEANGYLSVAKGDHVNAWLQFQGPGDAGCAYPTYVFARMLPNGQQGWLPPHVIWERYVDANGRAWAHDPSSGEFAWEDEL